MTNCEINSKKFIADVNLEKIKALTKNRIIEIRISDELDETSYLMSTAANRRSLAKSLREFEGKEIISKTPEELGL